MGDLKIHKKPSLRGLFFTPSFKKGGLGRII